MKNFHDFKIIVLDVDNTLFDWVEYYSHSFTALLGEVSRITKIPKATLASEARLVFENDTVEYPFVVQDLPSVVQFYKNDIPRILSECVSPSRQTFLAEGEKWLKPYAGVSETMREIKNRYSHIKFVALTDAPRYVAMWKLNKLGLLDFFDAVYGLKDPRIPVCAVTQKVKVDYEILIKHLQQSDFGYQGKVRVLPEEYEKPGTRGFKTILMDYSLDEDLEHRKQVLFVGDNLAKDILLGKTLGVHTAWAKFGTTSSEEAYELLFKFAPQGSVRQKENAQAGDPQNVDWVLNTFSDLLKYFT